MILAFLVIALIGAAVALRMPKTYAAHSSLLIRLSPEYVYQPKVGDAARGATPDNDQVVQSELEILQQRCGQGSCGQGHRTWRVSFHRPWLKSYATPQIPAKSAEALRTVRHAHDLQ